MKKLCTVALLCSLAVAQQKAETLDGLIDKQALLARQMAALDVQMRAVADAIEGRQPAEAARIREAWQLMQQLLIERDMQTTQDLLARGSTFEARQLAGEVVENLARLLAVLQATPTEAPRPDRLPDLLALHRRLQALAEAQRDQLADPEAAGDMTAQADRQGALAGDAEGAAAELAAGAAEGSARARAGEATRSAAGNMRTAQRRLGEREPEDARGQQEDALDALDDALEALEQEIADAWQREHTASLFNLRAALDAIIAEQEGINQRSEDLEAQRVDAEGSQRFLRKYLLKSASLSIEQAALAEELAVVRLQLADEGARVFSFVAESARIDMQLVSERLQDDDAARRTDAHNRGSQQRILADLQGLRQALERALRAASAPGDPGSAGPGVGPDQEPPLVSQLEELRLLQQLQLATREQTAELARSVRQVDALSLVQQALLERLAAKQGNLVDLLEELLQAGRAARPAVE